MAQPSRIQLIGAATVATVALTLAACSSTPTPAPTDGATTGATPVNIALLGYTPSDFVDSVIEGAESIVTADGGSVTFFSADFDPQQQDSQCQDAITSGRYQAFIIIPVDPATAIPCAEAAAAAGIPVGTFETAIGPDPYALEPQVDGVVAVANTTLSTQVEADSELILGACGDADPCKVIAEVASATDRWTNDLVNGLKEALAPRVEFVHSIETFYDPGAMAGLLPDALTANADANVLFTINDQTALAAIEVIAGAGLSDQIKVTGLGGTTEGVEAIKAGKLYGTTGNWPIQNGAFLATALVAAVNGGTPAVAFQDMLLTDTPTVITIDNVDEFTPEWGH